MIIGGDSSINKLIILFVFDKMESALSETTILDMCCSSNNWIAYMDCKLTIDQIIEDGLICKVDSADGAMFIITPDGRDCLANFYINIPSSTRKEIALFVKNNSLKFRTRQECVSDYYLNIDGTYTVLLKILAPAQPMLELKIVVPDRKTAQYIYKKWEEKAADAYQIIYENLVD
jgi:hypothetical protein